jgi:hypothetical protein
MPDEQSDETIIVSAHREDVEIDYCEGTVCAIIFLVACKMKRKISTQSY